MKEKELKVGVLGAGDMGRTVIEHLQQCAEVQSIVAYDVCENALKLTRNQFQCGVTAQLREVLEDPEVRLVFVTAANDAHKELTIQALEAGKAVMCEKPMANTLAGAREMVEAAERADAFLQIGFEARYSKLYVKVKEWIDAGLLGEVLNVHCFHISSSWPKNSWRTRNSRGGSMFGEKLSHYVDLPRWWVGDAVREIHSVCAPNIIPYYEVHDNYHATYRFASGAVGHLTFMMGPAATFHGDPLQNVVAQQQGDGHALRYLVVGSKGAAETDVFQRTIKRWEFGDSPEYFTSDWVENLTWDQEEDHVYFHNTLDQTRDIVHRVAAGLPPRISVRDAYETMELCFAAESSAELRKAVCLDEWKSEASY